MTDISVTWNTKEFDKKISKVTPKMDAGAGKGAGRAADELLRLSLAQVPFDTGHLQSTGKKTQKDLESSVGYNTPYAVRVHEHPEFRFQRGRKGKYLEDPLKNNTSVFMDIIKNAAKEELNG